MASAVKMIAGIIGKIVPRGSLYCDKGTHEGDYKVHKYGYFNAGEKDILALPAPAIEKLLMPPTLSARARDYLIRMLKAHKESVEDDIRFDTGMTIYEEVRLINDILLSLESDEPAQLS